jgi:hypothetical protein
MNITGAINLTEYKDKEYYTENTPINSHQAKTDVRFKQKEPAKVKHGVLIAFVLVAGVLYLSTKLDERF